MQTTVVEAAFNGPTGHKVEPARGVHRPESLDRARQLALEKAREEVLALENDLRSNPSSDSGDAIEDEDELPLHDRLKT